jgi:phenylacetate-CoA ligase
VSSLPDQIYLSSPIWLQQCLVAAYGWRWYRRRFGGKFSELLQEYRERERWTAKQFRSYQEARLENVLRAAWQSPHYRQVFNSTGLQPGMPAFEALALLPFLSKEILRSHPKDLLTQPPSKDVMVFRSSGTTGTPTEIYFTRDFHALELAIPAARNFGWAGIDYRARRVMFGVRKVCRFEQDRPPFWRFSPAEDMAYASIYHLSPRFIPAYLSFLRQYRPAVIMGYPSALRVIAKYALENNALPAPAQGVFTTSETVTEQDRVIIESAWQCKIYDRYGAVENCHFACQCEYGRYHVSPDVGILEIVDAAGQASPPGVMGEVICTGLHNTLQPLIRYRIGDAARWAEDQYCPCGREMPILEGIDGRVEDICFTADGRQMLRFDTVFKGIENILEAQVIQEKLDQFIIRVVPGAGFGQADINRMAENMRLHVGEVRVNIETVDHIPRTAAGKFRAVICNLPREVKEALRQGNR